MKFNRSKYHDKEQRHYSYESNERRNESNSSRNTLEFSWKFSTGSKTT